MTVGGKLFSRVTVYCKHRFSKEAHGSDLAQVSFFPASQLKSVNTFLAWIVFPCQYVNNNNSRFYHQIHLITKVLQDYDSQCNGAWNYGIKDFIFNAVFILDW